MLNSLQRENEIEHLKLFVQVTIVSNDGGV